MLGNEVRQIDRCSDNKRSEYLCSEGYSQEVRWIILNKRMKRSSEEKTDSSSQIRDQGSEETHLPQNQNTKNF